MSPDHLERPDLWSMGPYFKTGFTVPVYSHYQLTYIEFTSDLIIIDM